MAVGAEPAHGNREKLENPQTVSDTSQAALKQLYGGLSQDMQSGAANVSPDAFASFIKANAATAAGHNVLESYLNPILNASSPETAAQHAMAQARQGGDRLGDRVEPAERTRRTQ